MFLKKNKPLKHFTKYVFQGIATGKDEVFLISEQTCIDYNLEKDILYPILKGKDIRKYSMGWSNNFIIYPYEKISFEK